MKCACDHCDMTILANDPWCSVCYLECRRMSFVEIFDRNAPVEAGLIPIWTTMSLWWALAYLPDDAPSGSWLVVFGFLIGLHWLFRFGKWMEDRARPIGNLPGGR